MNEIDLAYKHCESITKKHAKNFYYAFRTLPHRKRRAIYAIYAFCRICDDIADEDIPLSTLVHKAELHSSHINVNNITLTYRRV